MKLHSECSENCYPGEGEVWEKWGVGGVRSSLQETYTPMDLCSTAGFLFFITHFFCLQSFVTVKEFCVLVFRFRLDIFVFVES
jgi:hypothetical protein